MSFWGEIRHSFLLWLHPFILSGVISPLISSSIVGLPTWGVPLSDDHFAFSYCSWGSQGKNTEVVCHSLLQWTTFCQTSPPWPTRLGWPHTAWLSFIELDKAVVRVIRLTGCDGLHRSMAKRSHPTPKVGGGSREEQPHARGQGRWGNRQIWPWNAEWSRAKANRVLPRERTGHSKHPLPKTQEKTLHMNITRWSTPKSDWLYSLQPKMEKLYTVSKNKTESWLWLRSWTPYCQIQT